MKYAAIAALLLVQVSGEPRVQTSRRLLAVEDGPMMHLSRGLLTTKAGGKAGAGTGDGMAEASTTPTATTAVGPCGAGGEPVCAGDALVGRKYECDFGFVRGADDLCVPYSRPPPPGPGAEGPSAAGACGGAGQPVCTGDQLSGREFECDYGFFGEDDVCVPYIHPDAPGPVSSGPCGMGGQPVCMGSQLSGRKYECDFGYMGVDGVCVPYLMTSPDDAMAPTPVVREPVMPEPMAPVSTPPVVEATEEPIVPEVPEPESPMTVEPIAPGAAPTACGRNMEPVCKGDQLDERAFECDFGFTNQDGVCAPYMLRDRATPPAPTPMTPTPVEPAPVEPAPVEPAPVEPAPAAKADTPEVPPPPPPPPAPTPPAEGGEFTVCITEPEKWFGPPYIERRPAGVEINSAGQCSWGEFSGGFDGYPSGAIGDGHEREMDEAIEQMFPGDFDKQTKFLSQMISIAQPINLDLPVDKKLADDGERMRNIRKLNAACSSLITIGC